MITQQEVSNLVQILLEGKIDDTTIVATQMSNDLTVVQLDSDKMDDILIKNQLLGEGEVDYERVMSVNFMSIIDEEYGMIIFSRSK